MSLSNPFLDNTNIHIRILRNNLASQDDHIVIRYKDEDTYQVFYKDGDVGSNTTYCTVLSGEDLDTYIECLFLLLGMDKDPFTSIQLMIPCFPTLLYQITDLRGKKLRNTIHQILPILCTAMRL